ncbi:hypothetical protein C5167_002692 [Papaver somniferum]|uniref:Uncharacterized protein n=1 Tax=Papaver somniferum TaxID=3469 RepID=A0A4Y7L1J3_PAPSO|nr:uncharacterized protein LOC113308580 [Papaver somniferum]RZC78490.1 hypothetical protein C5167_002692 [Papaver somniferum]
MENSVGFMTVFAVSGSVVLVALQAHKRLLSDFMKKVELELGTAAGVGKVQQKKKVHFADDVIEPSSNNKEYRKQRSRLNMDRSSSLCNSQCSQMINVPDEDKIPENRRALYKGIVQSKILKGNMVSAVV